MTMTEEEVGVNHVTRITAKSNCSRFTGQIHDRKTTEKSTVIMKNKSYIIAEAGVNHNGSLERAIAMVEKAAWAGADAVKFQTFKADNIVSVSAPKAAYQLETTSPGESQIDMLRKLEQSHDDQKKLFDYCSTLSIDFMSSPFDLDSIDFLISLGILKMKIPSCEITNVPYLKKIGSLNTKVILSTGMSYLGEVEQALDILCKAGTERKNVTLLHCNTQYPTPLANVNLRAMITMGAALGIETGYSDHTPGIEIPIAAAALGATIIEKHFTLDRSLEGPDHKASLEPEELKAMISAIRNVEVALGDGIKRPTESESENRIIMRKSIVARKFISANEQFTPENLAVKRPGNGMSPLCWETVITQKASRDYQKDEPIYEVFR